MTPGPELDRAVAIAMRVRDFMDPSINIPPYSTEFGPWTQECLDWLAAHVYEVGIDWTGDENPQWFGNVLGKASSRGESLPEAIARLIVAVAERERAT